MSVLKVSIHDFGDGSPDDGSTVEITCDIGVLKVSLKDIDGIQGLVAGKAKICLDTGAVANTMPEKHSHVMGMQL